MPCAITEKEKAIFSKQYDRTFNTLISEKKCHLVYLHSVMVKILAVEWRQSDRKVNSKSNY